jgi:hypothetical protein
MDFMTGMVLLQQEMNRKARDRLAREWSLGGNGPEGRCDDAAVTQSDRRAGPRRLLSFVLRRPDVAAATELERHFALGNRVGKRHKQADEFDVACAAE